VEVYSARENPFADTNLSEMAAEGLSFQTNFLLELKKQRKYFGS
jgi:hypothetical protein